MIWFWIQTVALRGDEASGRSGSPWGHGGMEDHFALWIQTVPLHGDEASAVQDHHGGMEDDLVLDPNCPAARRRGKRSFRITMTAWGHGG